METIIKMQCKQCGKEFYRAKRQCGEARRKTRRHTFCTKTCYDIYQNTSVTLPCGQCGKPVTRNLAEHQASKSGKLFCNRSCAASYNNQFKRKSRRSSCEIKLLKLLRQEFPDIDFIENDKELLDGLEIDIAIPELEMGIEWNGIVHFKPIYGKRKLDRIQELDAEKQERARERNIDLIIIPDLVSSDAKIKSAFQDIKKIIHAAKKNATSE